MMSQLAGYAAEEEAKHYLIKQGLRWVESNYRCRAGEIDLIMRDREFIVFVEVKKRSSNAFGGAVASITLAKRKKLIKTALYYLMAHRLVDKIPVRFDVLCFEGQQPVTWIQNAFGSDF